MTKSSPPNQPTNKQTNQPTNQPTKASTGSARDLTRPLTLAVFLLTLLLYVTTLAQYPLWGDPTEFTFVAHVLGIAHPPGYAFMTLVHKLFQTIIPVGTVAWRSHLVSGLVGAGIVTALFTTVRVLLTHTAARVGYELRPNLSLMGALLTAVVISTGANFWQHAIHANPHLITAGFLALNLCLLTLWGVEQERKRGGEEERAGRFSYSLALLLTFSLSTGLGVVHHPLTAFAFPAYALFILWMRPGIWREWRVWLGMLGMAGVGLALFLYYPWRSAAHTAVGPQSMNTLNGFLDHVLARGLAESLPYFSLAEMPLRQLTYLSILFQQYAFLMLVLALVGLGGIWSLKATRPFALLYTLAFLTTYGFVISLRAQDIMAYLLGPNLVVGVLAGLGLWVTAVWLDSRPGITVPFVSLVLGALLLLPIFYAPETYRLVSLREYNAAQAYSDAVFTQFAGRGEGVTLLNNWEAFTPLEYARLVENRWPDEADVRPVLVSAAEPWLPSVFNTLPGGPVFLNSYRPEIVAAGFRLRARAGGFEEVVEPGESSLPAELTAVGGSEGVGQGIELVGYEVVDTAVTGDFVPLTLALRLPVTTTAYYAPVLQIGPISYPFTTDSHLITPLWQPNEIIVERFDFALPHDLAPGVYPVTLRLHNLSQNADAGINLTLPTLRVTEAQNDWLITTAGLLANYRQRVGLRSASVWQGVRRHGAGWDTPLEARRNDVLNILLTWEVLDYPEESYTVFLHLIDEANRPWLSLDYTPLGGSAPTHLWFPKWLPGQRYVDPYRMVIPADLPAGTYFIEVGLYEMTSQRRLHMHDRAGNLVGDRFILGQVNVGE